PIIEAATFGSALARIKGTGPHGNVTEQGLMRMGTDESALAEPGYETAIADAIAACDGDLRGTLKVLLMANEYLEQALAEAQSALQFAVAGDVASPWPGRGAPCGIESRAKDPALPNLIARSSDRASRKPQAGCAR